jgi:hypothetical protein
VVRPSLQTPTHLGHLLLDVLATHGAAHRLALTALQLVKRLAELLFWGEGEGRGRTGRQRVVSAGDGSTWLHSAKAMRRLWDQAQTASSRLR